MLVQLARVDGWKNLDDMFLRALVRMCWDVQIDPSVLLAVMSIETAGTFNPATRNPGKGQTATGLIQMIERTARALGTTTADLARMSNVTQLRWVERYFRRYGPKKPLVSMRPVDTYLVVFSPAFIGRPLSTVMFKAGSKEYKANAKLDSDESKAIEVGDVDRVLSAKLARAATREPLLVEVWERWRGPALVAVVVGGTAAAAVVVARQRA
jgi:hypothetical protein